ncbi:MAG: hypothetical protein ICV83_33835, partial [Cytophagales bacterium]|nr:hypothetical protein [Cytophagales bacterium]
AGRWREDGEIDYLGRKDGQLKFHGHRIEAEEIEAALNQHPGIRRSFVQKRTARNGDEILVAYYLSRHEIETEAIREVLKEHLFKVVLPTHYVWLSKLPLTINGKLNLKALPDPEKALNGKPNYVPPGSAVEAQLAEIWQQVLGRSRVGVSDNFFEIGGHSLKATQVLARLYKQLDVELDMRSLFAHPTIGQLAPLVEKARKSHCPPIEALPEQDYYPLSRAQKRLWLAGQRADGASLPNISCAFVLEGELHRAALLEAFGDLLERHQILRTTFHLVEEEPKQKIHPFPWPAFRAAVVEAPLAGPAPGDARRRYPSPEQLRALAEQEAGEGFDLQAGPLLRVTLAESGPQSHHLLVTVHPLVADGWSMEPFLDQLFTAYDARRQGSKAGLPPLRIHYKDYAHWHNALLARETFGQHRRYWLDQFKEPEAPLALPPGCPGAARGPGRPGSKRIGFGERSEALKSFSRQHRVSPYVVFLAAVKALLFRHTGAASVTVGTPVSGRNQPGLEDQIGVYGNLLALRTRLDPRESFGQLLLNVKRCVHDGLQAQQYPFDELPEALAPDRAVATLPLFRVGFSWHTPPATAGERLPGLKITPVAPAVPTGTADLWFACQ